jgi:hypothetical protein
MQVEGNIGHDLSLIANAADIAMALARAGNSGSANRAGTIGIVNPGDLASTSSSTIVAAVPLIPKASGIFVCMFTVEFALAAADTVGFAGISLFPSPAVTVSGGSQTGTFGGLHYEATGLPIATTGTSGFAFGQNDQVIPTDQIADVTAVVAGPVYAAAHVGTTIAIGVSCQTTGGHAITGMNLTFLCYEL